MSSTLLYSSFNAATTSGSLEISSMLFKRGSFTASRTSLYFATRAVDHAELRRHDLVQHVRREKLLRHREGAVRPVRLGIAHPRVPDAAHELGGHRIGGHLRGPLDRVHLGDLRRHDEPRRTI